jgi:hypothetical protein
MFDSGGGTGSYSEPATNEKIITFAASYKKPVLS